LFGSVLSYLVFARAETFLLLLVSRILDGGSGATINVAQAYLADESAPEHRARAMGKIGAAVGLGFIVGPILGGITAGGGYELTGYIAAGISLINLVAAWWLLPESRPQAAPANLPVVATHWSGIARPLGVLFLTTLAFSVMYVVFPLYGEAALNASRSTVSYWFAIIGLVTAVVQGGVLGRLVARYAEGGVARIGATLLAAGFLLVPIVTRTGDTGWIFFAVLVLLGAGYGLGGPAMLGLISRMSGAARQGRILGVAQSASSMSRIVGPLIAGGVMQGINAEAAFVMSAAMAVGALGLALTLRAVRPLAATSVP
jgi:predicted MFS family arabinose efflux permease